MKAFVCKSIFIEKKFVEATLLVEEGIIVDILYTNKIPNKIELEYLNDIVIPGFVDIQINGCGGALFNRDLSLASLKTMHDYCIAHGITSFFPTLITCPEDQIIRALELIEIAQEDTLRFPALEAMHLEGPYIGKTNSGTHSHDYITQLKEPMLGTLIQYIKKGRLGIITLAPENVEPKLIKKLSDAGVLISLGHSNADTKTFSKAIEAGARLVTHLYNGMPPLKGREPSLVSSSFLNKNVYASIIPDLVHVCSESLTIAKTIMKHRLFAVSDATATGDEKEIILNGELCTIKEGIIKNTINGSLAGSASFMDKIYNNINILFGIEEAIHMCSTLPSKIISKIQTNKKRPKKGIIKKNYCANFISLVKIKENYRVKRTFINGKDYSKMGKIFNKPPHR